MPMNVTDTAAIIATVRDAESELPPEQRLFVDPYARLFASGPDVDEVVERFRAVPVFREQVRVRTRFIDDFVRRGLADGARQIVILGAGFDCRALRLEEIAVSGASVFEVDFDEQLEKKRAVLERAGVAIPERVRFVGCDFMAADFDSSLGAALAAAGYSAGAMTLFLWEGVISYLNPPEIERTMRWMAASGGPGSRVVYNYSMNAMFGLGPETMSARAEAAGFASVDDRSLSELYRRYLRSEPPSDIADLFRLAIASR